MKLMSTEMSGGGSAGDVVEDAASARKRASVQQPQAAAPASSDASRSRSLQMTPAAQAAITRMEEDILRVVALAARTPRLHGKTKEPRASWQGLPRAVQLDDLALASTAKARPQPPRGEAPQTRPSSAPPSQEREGRGTGKLDDANPTKFREPEPAKAKSPPFAPVIEIEKNERAELPVQKGGGGKPPPPSGGSGGGGGGSDGRPKMQERVSQPNFRQALALTVAKVKTNMLVVFVFTIAMNVLVLAVPIYLFQIADRVLTSRSVDTLVMLTLITAGAIVGQVLLDVFRRRILMRTASEIETRLSSPILSAAARSALGGSGRDYQVLGDLQHIRNFVTGGTLLAMLDAPLAPIFILAVFLVHPHLGFIVCTSIVLLMAVAFINRQITAKPFAEANAHLTMANLNLESLSRNSQIINALGMIPEAVRMWGRANANSLRHQVTAQDRNVFFTGVSKGVRLFAQIAMLGWGAHLALDGRLTGGMVIASSIIASRALAPVEGTIEGWRTYIQSRAAYDRIAALLRTSPLNVERLRLPQPTGRLDVERVLFVPPPNKRVILNGVTFSLEPGETLAIIGDSGAGKSTLGKMLVGSIVPTAGSVRLDLMELKNWDPRQLGENIGYLPQDIQLFPASIKANIARMREDVTDEMIFEAASLAGVHKLIASLPQGYETMIAGDGAPLSGGQKQRIGLARAFFGNPRLVILDEPNSNLDTAGEQALAQAIEKAKTVGTTVIAITQRTALLRCVDKIMVMKDGTVQAIGERQAMLQALAGPKKPGPGGAPGGEVRGDQA